MSQTFWYQVNVKGAPSPLKNEYCCDTPRQMVSLQRLFEAVQPMSNLPNVWCAPWPDSAYPDSICPHCHRDKAINFVPCGQTIAASF